MKTLELTAQLTIPVKVNMNVIAVNLESQPCAPTKMGRYRLLSFYVHVYWEDFWFGMTVGMTKERTRCKIDLSLFLNHYREFKFKIDKTTKVYF